MCYILCWSIFSSRLHSYFIPFPDLYAEFPCFYANLFPSPSTVPVTYVGGSPYIVYIRGHGEHARYAQTRKGGGSVTQIVKNSMQVCTQNYSDTQFIAPIRGLNPGPSTAPGTAGEWGGELRGSCGSTTSQQKL